MGRRRDRSKYLWLRREPFIVVLDIKMKKKPSVLGHDIICEWTNLFRTFSHTQNYLWSSYQFLCPYMLFFVWSDHFIYFLCLWTSCFVFTNEYSNYRSFFKKVTVNLDVMAHGRNNYIFPWIKKCTLYLLGYHQLTRMLCINTHLFCNSYMRWTSLQSSWLLFVALSTSNNIYIH